MKCKCQCLILPLNAQFNISKIIVCIDLFLLFLLLYYIVYMYNNEETINPLKNKQKQNVIQTISCKIQSLYKGSFYIFLRPLLVIQAWGFFVTNLQHFLWDPEWLINNLYCLWTNTKRSTDLYSLEAKLWLIGKKSFQNQIEVALYQLI